MSLQNNLCTQLIEYNFLTYVSEQIDQAALGTYRSICIIFLIEFYIMKVFKWFSI